MIIKGIRIKNFLSYKDSGYIEFDRGTTVMIGENGAGKTAIIDGIMFSLFGKNERTRKLEDLQRRGTSKPLEAELVFEENGKIYKIKRSWSNGITGAYLYIIEDGEEKLIAERTSSVNTKIEEILGLDSNTMANTIYLKQGEIEGLLSMQPAQRKEMIDRLLGISKFEDAYRLMRDLINLVKEKRSNVESEEKGSESDLENLKKQKEDIEKNIDDEERRIKEIEEELEKLEEEREVLDKRVKEMDEKKDRSRDIENEIKRIEEKIQDKEKIIEEYENLKKELERDYGDLDKAKKEVESIPLLEKLKELENSIGNLDKEAKPLEKDRNFIEEIAKKAKEEYSGEVKERTQDILMNYTNLSTSIKKDIEDLKKDLNSKEKIEGKLNELIPEGYDYESYLNKIEKEINDLKKEKDYKINELGKSKGNLERYKEWLKSIEDANQCPLCGREFDEEHSRDSVRDRLITKRKKEEIKISALEKELEKISTKIKNLEDIQKKLREISIEELERLKKEIESLEKAIKENNKNLKVIQSKALKIYNELTEKIEETRNKIRELEKKKKDIIDKLGKVPGDLDKEIARLRELEKKLQKLELKENYYQKASKYRDELLKQKREKEEELKKIGYDEKEHERVQSELEKIKSEINKLEGKKYKIDEYIEKDKNKLQEIMEEIKNKESELENIKKKMEKLDKIIADLTKIRNGFNKDNIPKLIRGIAIPAIQNYAKSYASQFNFGISDIEIKGDFSMNVYFGDRKFSLDMLSGGQKTAIAIALRLGIARYLGKKLTSVIMDEPTANLDEERRSELVELLKEFMENPDNLSQLIIVTHHRELEQIAETLYRVKIVNGISSVKEEV